MTGRSDRAYRWIQKAYSRRFGEQFGDGMRYAFEGQLREAQDKGWWAVTLFWLRSLAHALWFGLGERLSGLRRNRRMMLSRNPELSPQECKEILMSTARPMEFEGVRAPRVVDAAAAVERAVEAGRSR
jgi:hypothetical protein